MEISPDVHAGQAVYGKTVLTLYDAWVLGLSNSLFWKCPTPVLASQFTALASPNHLDVGVGTGYYPDRCIHRPAHDQRLGLLDLNPNSLAAAKNRTRRFHPEIYHANVLDPMELGCDPFDSISLVYLFHCLPGTLEEKSKALDYLLPLLNPGGTLFGATILGRGVPTHFTARRLMALYNKKGIFHNMNDEEESLTSCLEQRLTRVDVRVKGCVALFSGKKA